VSELTFTGRDGIPIEPLYTRPVKIEVPARAGPWQVRPVVSSAEEAQEAIAGGADSLWWYRSEDAPNDLGCPVVDNRTPVASSWGAHLNGATELDELAYLYTGETDVREVRTAVGRDVFKGIAKLRALRVLWLERTGQNPFIHAVGSFRSLTRYDAHTNILRQTTQAFAAATGGADAITLWPFDQAGAELGALARRVALNTQLILRCEAGLDEIAEPAKGSFYLDWLTHEMVERTKRTTRKELMARLRLRTDPHEPIVGVTEFPSADEEPLPAIEIEGATLPSDSAAFETLRDNPAGPIYLCKLGTLRENREAAAFARNLFITGGYEVVEGDGPDGFALSGAEIACIVGPGDVEIPGAKRVLRNLDPKLDKRAFLTEMRA